MKMKSAVVSAQGQDIEIMDVILDEPKANEVLIRTVASGICHTDIAGRDAGMSPYPVALGHEGAGIVEKVGSAVTTVEPGDHVVISFGYCGHCRNCRTGHPALCSDLNVLNFGGAQYDGTHRHHLEDGSDVHSFFGQSSLSQYIVADEHGVVKVDKDVDLRLLGPLACGLQTGAGTVLNYIKPEFGSTMVVAGVGGVGLASIMAAKICNLKHIIAVDIHDNRLELAKELGATAVINSKTISTSVEEAIRELVPEGVDYSIDTTGYSPIIKELIHALRPAGTALVIGMTGDLTLNIQAELMGESKKLVGLVEGDAIPQLFIPTLVEYYKAGLFPFDKMVKFYPFENLQEAVDAMHDGSVIKPVVTFE
ncbi:NAD(P)-dependent alcohol dehydrogenase [Streptococcus moroccensis]|uniref:Aryl-alcohol dehydrogenase n=1 Tax=Streptococcus moroccensis TaxID=1451356 RepID=A0ABT9YRU1_9STRE|nr:NAD(P)-dependent alcohol dehydrogenase [Streptococcus moroccensis]MDQ0222716.1 aryl-alcohol dehydrogenase [Streptococcus moroccensis]